jgi:hypothetical protein
MHSTCKSANLRENCFKDTYLSNLIHAQDLLRSRRPSSVKADADRLISPSTTAA